MAENHTPVSAPPVPGTSPQTLSVAPEDHGVLVDLTATSGQPRDLASGRVGEPAPPRELNLELLHGVRLNVQVVIGEIVVLLRDLLSYEVGQVITLDRPAGAPADVVVNGKLMFHGEIVVIDDEYAIRITEVVSSEASA